MTNLGAPVVGGDVARSRLRLKRVFLRTLVISLVSCALVAVAALLAGTFNDTTAKILMTLAALAVHSGVAMVLAHALERQVRTILSRSGLILFAANFVVLLICIWWPGPLDAPAGRASATTLALLCAYVVAVPCADLMERRAYQPLPAVGVASCILAFVMILVCIWAESRENEAFAKATAIAGLAAFSFAHTALLLRVPTGGRTDWLRAGTLLCVWLVAAMLGITIIWEVEDELWFRLLGAAGVLDASGSLSLLIVAKLRQVGKTEQLQTAAPRVELKCPRCATPQCVDIGATQCSACGLKFRIEVEEPRCVKCDYVLWQLPERRCPECGTPF